MNASKSGLWLVCLLALAQTSPVRVAAWTYQAGAFAPTSERAASVAPKMDSVDLNGDGQAETVRLAGGRAEILTGGGVAWQSPAVWQVAQAAVTDLNRDGQPEVTLLVWRAFEPWPIDRYLVHPGRIEDFHNAAGLSCHIILIGWALGGFNELWAGSAMADPFTAVAVADLDGDGRQELVALEGKYADGPGAEARALTAWEWNGFGFTLLARTPGRFGQMAVAGAPDGRPVILTQD